jgi:hypothetical protein
MKKLIVCFLVLAVATVGFSQTNTKPVTQSKDKTVTSDEKKSSTQARPSTATDRKKPTTPPSPYVNGKALLKEKEFKFGYTPMDCTIFRSFYIKNVGTDTLDIVQVKPG